MNWLLYNICYFWCSLKAGFTLPVILFFFFLFRDGVYQESGKLTVNESGTGFISNRLPGLFFVFSMFRKGNDPFEDAVLLYGPAIIALITDVEIFQILE